MIGLVIKDILVMRKTIRTYALFLIFYLIMTVLGLFTISFTTAILQLIVMLLPMSAFSFDEMAKWEKIIEVRDAVNGALETARAEKKIGKSLEADVALTVPAEDAFLAEMDGAALADLLIVSKVEVTVGGELAVSVSEAAGTKCPRCWKHSTAADENGLCPRCASVIAKCADFGEV